MKNFYVFTLVYFLTMGISFSQNKIDLEKIKKESNLGFLKQFSEKKTLEFQYNKALADSLATVYNWPKIISKDNAYSELIGVDKNFQPIYYSIDNFGAGVTSRANKLYTGGGLGLNLHGEGMTSGIWDAGSAMPSHEIFGGRLSLMDGSPSTHYHAAHVAGTVIGSATVQNGQAKGMAYMANGHSYDWNNDHAEIATAAANGLLLSNHSYGWNPNFVDTIDWGKYSESSQAIDQIMFNAPYYQFVSSAGNSRGNFNLEKNGYDLIHGHAASKNGITVAAVNQVDNYTGPSSVVMSSFSSWGPTDDGRIKPDISAKGVDTFSATDNSTTSYSTLSGTSMASPSVNGTLLLLQQHYNQLNGQFMKSSTLRGLMAHSADEAGTTLGPDYSFGWGLINAEKAAQIISSNQVNSIINERVLQNNETYSINIRPLAGQPILATICWTDPAGVFSNTLLDDPTPSLVNDLDIRLVNNSGETFLPWKLNPSNPSAAATQGDNLVDNIEKIEIPNSSGSYTLTVSHKGNLVNNQQAYSLIISGITTNDFWVTTDSNVINICQGTTNHTQPLNMHFANGYSGIVNMSLINAPMGISHVFTPSSMTGNGTFSLEISQLNTLAPGVYPLTVRASNGIDDFDVIINLNILTSNFDPITLTSPLNNANSIIQPITFSWSASSNVLNYDFELALDSGFLNIINQQNIPSNSLEVNNLNFSTTYYWRVKPNNNCGSGLFSNIYQFITSCETPQNVTFTNITSDTATIILENNSPSIAIEVVPQGISPTGVGNIYNSPFILTNLNSNTCYDVYIRNICNIGFSDWVGPYTLCTTPDYCGGDNFNDTGGPTGNYQNYENWTETVYPEQVNERVRAVFNSFSTENGWDYLRIYNGPNTSSPLLANLTGNINPGQFASTHPTGALTFWFVSDSSVVYSGWDATIICEPMPACPNPPTNITLVGATGSAMTVQWLENNGSTSWQVEIVPQGSNPTGNGTTVTENPYTFTGLNPLTNYNVYVRSICVDGFSDWAMSSPFSTGCGTIQAPYFHNVENQNWWSEISQCWRNITPQNNQFNWSTSSGHGYNNSTGPANARSGEKIFTASGWTDGTETAVLLSPVVNISGLTNPSLEFYNFRHGQFVGALHVDIINNGVVTPNVLVLTGSHQTSSYDNWQKQVVDLSAFTGEVQARFRAVSGGSYDNEINIDDISFKEMADCQNDPDNISFVASTGTTLTVSWIETGSSTSWQVEIVPQGSNPTGNGTTVTENPYTFTGLNPLTNYNVYVRSICVDGFSDWAMSSPFSTGCGTIQAPYFHNVENQNWWSEISQCWRNITPQNNQFNWSTSSGHGYNNSTGPANARSGEKIFTASGWTDGTETAVLLSPVVNISGLTNPSLEFYNFRHGQFVGALHVDIINNGVVTPNVLVLTGSHQTSSYDNWQKQVVDLSAFTGEVQARFRAVSGGSYDNEINIDDISFKEMADCPFEPDNLTHTSNNSEITVSWTENGSSTSWQVEIVPQGSNPTGNGTTVTTNPMVYSGLPSATCYNFFVRSVCANNFSEWVGPYTVCTTPDYCGGDNFYDTGGLSGNYVNSENWILTIYPDQDNERVKAVFNSFNTESCCDRLRVYNGPNSSSPLLATLQGNINPGQFASTHPTGALTFWFTSDSSVVSSGWDATIICEPNLSSGVINFENEIRFHPNPVKDFLTIDAFTNVSNYQIIDLTGRLLVEKKVNQLNFQIDFTQYPTGMYILKLFDDEKAAIFKIKKR